MENKIQKTIRYVLDLYELKNIRQLEELIEEKNKLNSDLKEIGFLKMITGIYYMDCK